MYYYAEFPYVGLYILLYNDIVMQYRAQTLAANMHRRTIHRLRAVLDKATAHQAVNRRALCIVLYETIHRKDTLHIKH